MLGITPSPRQPLPDYAANPGQPQERHADLEPGRVTDPGGHQHGD